MRLEYRGGGSAKFWEPRLAGAVLTVHFGRIGTAGQTRETAFGTPAAAKAALAKLVAEKTHKGYRPAGKAAPAKATPKVSKRRDAVVALATALGGTHGAKIAARGRARGR